MSEDHYPGDEVFDKIEALCEKGEYDLERGKPMAALHRFLKAFKLLPEPATRYPSGTWLLANIGDLNYYFESYEQGVMYLTQALDFPEGADNPFIQLRLGQCLLELEKEVEAKVALQKAYELEGVAIFEGEDSKYLDFLQG